MTRLDIVSCLFGLVWLAGACVVGRWIWRRRIEIKPRRGGMDSRDYDAFCPNVDDLVKRGR